MSLLCSDGPPMPPQKRQELQRCLPEFNRMLPCFAGKNEDIFRENVATFVLLFFMCL